MKPKEMRERTDGELEEMERDFRRQLWKTRFDNFTNQLDNTSKIRRLRRDLARVITIRSQRGAEAAAAEAPKE